jgi:hypothetical protein
VTEGRVKVERGVYENYRTKFVSTFDAEEDGCDEG